LNPPFDIEEIFQGEGSGAARLPRQQSGSSPQGLAVTLLADYTACTGAWVPSAAIVALLGEAGVSAAGARTAISRLARRGVLDGTRHGRNSVYRLSPPVADLLRAGGTWIASYGTDTEPWDGWWTLIAFSLPQEQARQRYLLRSHLRWWGCAPLYDGLWVSPHPLPPESGQRLGEVDLSAMTVFRAQHLDMAVRFDRNPINAWDITAIAEQYETFIRHWGELVPRVRAGQLVGPETVRARTQVMDAYRRFPPIDPQLPLQLLPTGWLRRTAREVFVAIYDGLAEPAEAHLRSAIAGYALDRPILIHANTIADLIAGKCVHSDGNQASSSDGPTAQAPWPAGT
jgi:phenylacetic acid degradation operon negative regulatory protein